MSVTVRIVAPHFVAGVDIEGRVVTFAAPILRYTLGWSASRLRAYCDSKGWEAKRIPDREVSA